MENTEIAWTTHTFNPWRGCSKVSAGCANCYAEALVKRYGLDIWGKSKPRLRTSKQYWRSPYKWQIDAPRNASPCDATKVFCGSLCDVFEDREDVNAIRADLWSLIRSTPYLRWLLLTKRPENIEAMLPPDYGRQYSHVWLGATVESAEYVDRIEVLRALPAAVRFISYEPALGCLGDVDLTDIDWLIYGGESGPNFRPHNKEWARSIRSQCQEQNVAFFYKQGAAFRSGSDITLDDEIIQNFPREHPSRLCASRIAQNLV